MNFTYRVTLIQGATCHPSQRYERPPQFYPVPYSSFLPTFNYTAPLYSYLPAMVALHINALYALTAATFTLLLTYLSRHTYLPLPNSLALGSWLRRLDLFEAKIVPMATTTVVLTNTITERISARHPRRTGVLLNPQLHTIRNILASHCE